MNIVLQRNSEGKYVSDLILDRFQILQSSVGNYYYIYDHEKQDVLWAKNGTIDDYPSIEAAMAYLTNEPVKKVKKEKVIKTFVKKMPRKETALSYMRELINETEDDDETVANKILDKFPGSTYTRHMVKFQRKRMMEDAEPQDNGRNDREDQEGRDC